MTLTAYAVLVLLIGVLASRTSLLRAQVVLCLFGATTAIALPALGGAVIVVPVLCMPFLALRAFNESYGSGAAWHMSRPGFWLLMTVFWGLAVTAFIPRLMRGEILIITVDRLAAAGAALKPLEPVSGNVSQSVYAIGNVVMFVAARHLLGSEERMLVFGRAALWLATLNCVAAVLNLAQFYAGFPNLLQYVRTAYATFDAYEGSSGFMRIHGTWHEASAFAQFSLCMFAYSVNLWLSGYHSRWSGGVALLLLFFLAISTSTTAYVGLGMYLGILGLSLLRRGQVQGRLPRGAFLIASVVFLLLVVSILVLLETPIAAKFSNLFRVALIDKLDSSSAENRGAWNAQAWNNLWDSYGVGVGFGTARASSFLLTLMSNVGLIGTLMYAAFLWNVLRPLPVLPSPEPHALTVARASGHAVIGALCAAVLSGSAFDRRSEFYLLAAAASIGVAVFQPVVSRARRGVFVTP